MTNYEAFLASKAIAVPLRGVTHAPKLAKHLFGYQATSTDFLLRAGSGGLFLDTGMGKTLCELEWSRHAAEATNGRALILTPLAVARQIEAEGRRFDYEVRVIRDQSDVGDGINICNYDRFDKLDPGAFGSVACDESGIIKNFTGMTSRALIAAFAGHRFRLSVSATPAPNDHVEIAQHAAFCGLMARDEMLVRWFINDASDTKSWRLKRHGVTAFFDWMASWCRMAEHPRDLGDDMPGFDLLPLNIHRHHAVDSANVPTDGLFGIALSATTLHDVKRATAKARADVVAGLVHAEPDEPWVVWVDTDYEADAMAAVLPEAVEVRGSHSIERKEDALAAFADGSARVILSKPSICGHGLNWQHAARMAFVGRSFSYESWYQAVRREWRFGQTRPVDVHLIVAEGEDQIGRVIDRKADDHKIMKAAMVAAMRRAMGQSAHLRVAYDPRHEGRLPAWLL
jgi:superfamily II DNA or RNA helicase